MNLIRLIVHSFARKAHLLLFFHYPICANSTHKLKTDGWCWSILHKPQKNAFSFQTIRICLWLGDLLEAFIAWRSLIIFVVAVTVAVVSTFLHQICRIICLFFSFCFAKLTIFQWLMLQLLLSNNNRQMIALKIYTLKERPYIHTLKYVWRLLKNIFFPTKLTQNHLCVLLNLTQFRWKNITTSKWNESQCVILQLHHSVGQNVRASN